jgi:hypothetical protein
MEYFKNINLEQFAQANQKWLESYKQQNPADIITVAYCDIQYIEGVACVMVDDVTSSWGLSHDEIITQPENSTNN